MRKTCFDACCGNRFDAENGRWFTKTSSVFVIKILKYVELFILFEVLLHNDMNNNKRRRSRRRIRRERRARRKKLFILKLICNYR